MHSLIGCFPVENSKKDENDSNYVFEEADGQKYWRIEIKLSQIYKRVFFVKSEQEWKKWMEKLKQAAKVRKMTDQYLSTDIVLGQGSYGKVFKG